MKRAPMLIICKLLILFLVFGAPMFEANSPQPVNVAVENAITRTVTPPTNFPSFWVDHNQWRCGRCNALNGRNITHCASRQILPTYPFNLGPPCGHLAPTGSPPGVVAPPMPGIWHCAVCNQWALGTGNHCARCNDGLRPGYARCSNCNEVMPGTFLYQHYLECLPTGSILPPFPEVGDENLRTVLGSIRHYVALVSTIFIAFCGLLFVLYAIWIGWKFAKAQEDGARKNAKSQLLYAIIGILCISVVVTLTQFVLATPVTIPIDAGGIVGVAETYAAVRDIVNMILQVLVTLAVIFAVYIAWQFMKAEDDANRKKAKTQLLYTIFGAIAIVLINIIATTVLGSFI